MKSDLVDIAGEVMLAIWAWLTTRQTCRDCGLLKVEAESIECRCDWPNGLKRS
jgi:hypothetical protein